MAAELNVRVHFPPPPLTLALSTQTHVREKAKIGKACRCVADTPM